MRVTLALLALAVPVALLATHAAGDKASRESAALERGKELWNKPWVPNGKACAGCHAGGPNKMTPARVGGYPRWDKASDRVVSSQQKINLMISVQCKGPELELGSDDMNALEFYMRSLK
jgi:cytochrome c